MEAIANLVFVGFNSRVAALHRDTGEIVWQGKSHTGSGYTTVLLDGDRLIVSIIGYTYCPDAATGEQRWFNKLSGMGSGVASLASVNGTAMGLLAAAHAAQQQRSSSQTAP